MSPYKIFLSLAGKGNEIYSSENKSRQTDVCSGDD